MVLAAAGLTAIVVVLVAGAVSQISPASSSYRRTIDRGYAALAATVVAQSNSSAAQLSSFLRQGPGLDRPTFFSDLDALAAQSDQQWTRLHQITPPTPAVGAASDCASAFAGRAEAAAKLRNALEGVVGGRTGSSNAVGDQAGTVATMESVASSLESDDALWAQCRSSMRRGPGSARLPASAWVPDPSLWSPVSVSNFVAAVVGSPTLVATHQLVILDAVTNPAASQGSPGAPVVPATTSLEVQAVLEDGGNVDETGVAAVASLTASSAQATPGGGSSGSVPARGPIDLSAGRSIALTFPSLAVSPGASYTLKISATSASAAGATTVSLPVAISQAVTTTIVYSSASPIEAGGKVTYAATVSSSVAGLPSAGGTVAFSDDTTPIAGCGAQPVRHGQATCTVEYPAPGVHAITAAYSGDPVRSASTSASFIEKIVSAPASGRISRVGGLRRGVT